MKIIDMKYRIYNFIAFVGIALFYFPEKIHQGYKGPKMDLVKKIDWLGGFLSITGATLL